MLLPAQNLGALGLRNQGQTHPLGHLTVRVWLFTVCMTLACGQDPAPPEDRSPTLARKELAQRGVHTLDVQRCPEVDLSQHLCFRGEGLFVFIGPSGPLRADGSGDWYTALSGADPLKVAAVLERLGSGQRMQLQLPTGSKPSQVSAEEWAQVTAPQIEEQAGTLVFTAWYGNPPAFVPYPLRLEARPGTPARVRSP